MAAIAPESPSPGSSGAGFQKRVGALQTLDGRLQPITPALPPVIPDHEMLCGIGRGSYGEVWLARNVLGDYRAVKVIHRQHFESDHAYEREFEGLKRFEPVSRGDSSQVAVLHVGRNDSAGFYYYVMELADNANKEPPPTFALTRPSGQGEVSKPIDPATYTPRTLKSELMRRKRLPLDECVQIGLALTTALDHLHRHGLIHRDIKPSNVIFVNGVPKLADIGLVARIDATMSCVGTEGYIPPEGPGTAQADLYSLGKVLYEISSGKDRLAFPEPLTLLGEESEKVRLPELNAVIHRACHTDPKQRYPTALAMQTDLKRLERGESVRRRHMVRRRWAMGRKLAVATLALAALGLAAHSIYQTFVGAPEMVPASVEHPVAVPLKASVFVLPFRSVGTNQVTDDLCSRVTDAFIDSLALIEGVQRSPRKSGWRYLDEDDLRHALAKTNAMHHVLTGRISSSNDTLGLTLRLFRRSSDQPVWTEEFSGRTNELIALEKQAIRELAARLGLRFSTNEQQRVNTLLTNNLEALLCYQQAQTVYAREAGTQSGYTEVRKLAQKAMGLDHRYLDADWFDAYMLRNLSQDRAPADVFGDVQHRMLSILERDETHAEALNQMLTWVLFHERNWETAFAFCNREFQYRPKQEVLWRKAYVCRMFGWFDEARTCQDQSEHPEPTSGDQRFFMASARWLERRYTEGAQVARRTLELYPGHAEGYQWLPHCLVANSNYVEGIEASHKAQEVWKKQEMTALRGVAYAKMGQPDKAREVLQELLEIKRSGPYLQPYFIARVYAALNENAKALEWLEQADKDKSEYLIFADYGGLRTDIAWDDLKGEPRFKELLKKTGLDMWPRPKPKLPPPN
jgi:TolB-like protein